MAVNRKELTDNLRSFYDFAGKVVLLVGAGGGLLLDPIVKTKKLIAIDSDAEALGELRSRIGADGRRDSMELVVSEFENVILPGDVVYFEFCLHEMVDPWKALTHARILAPDTVVFDHSPASAWTFYAAEEDKVRRSAEALKRFRVRRRERFRTGQRFRDHAELLAKVTAQGPLATQRAERFAGATDIVIQMSYELALL